jgi:ABC-type uncharacterized transport system auxiliary subunit
MRPRYLPVVLSLCLFIGCATSAPTTNYYVLGLPIKSIAPLQKTTSLYSLAIEQFDTRELLLRRNIVWRSDSTVGYYTSDKWGELPGPMFTYRLYRRASESNLFSRVQLGAAAGKTDFILNGKVITFEEVDTREGSFGEVGLEAELTASDGKVIWSGNPGAKAPISGKGGGAAAQAISQATEETITILLSDVMNALQQSKDVTAHAPLPAGE